MQKKTSCRAWVLMAVLMAIVASASRAEQAVGLEAQGVDPWAALSTDLDVRDELGRPVRREVIERQLSESGLKSAEGASVFSALPRLKSLLRFLAAAAPLRAWFGGAREGAGGRATYALAPTRKTERAPALPLLSLGFILTAGALSVRPHARSRSTTAAAPLPLRC